MSDGREYVRVYYSIVDDPKFTGLGLDKLGAWLRLLMMADSAWPASAYLPGTSVIPRRTVVALSQRQLIDLLPDGKFRVHGLDTERTRRKTAAQKGADKRWDKDANAEQTDTDRTATAPSPDMPSQAEQSQADPSRAEPSTADADDPADVWWQLTGRYPSDKLIGWIDETASRFGSGPVSRAIAKAFIEDGSVSTLMSRAVAIVRRDARQLDLREKEEERRRLEEKRSRPVKLDQWQVDYRRAIEEKYGDAA